MTLLELLEEHDKMLAYVCEDFLALELVELRRRLLEVEARLVTRACHGCYVCDVAAGRVQESSRRKKVGAKARLKLPSLRHGTTRLGLRCPLELQGT